MKLSNPSQQCVYHVYIFQTNRKSSNCPRHKLIFRISHQCFYFSPKCSFNHVNYILVISPFSRGRLRVTLSHFLKTLLGVMLLGCASNVCLYIKDASIHVYSLKYSSKADPLLKHNAIHRHTPVLVLIQHFQIPTNPAYTSCLYNRPIFSRPYIFFQPPNAPSKHCSWPTHSSPEMHIQCTIACDGTFPTPPQTAAVPHSS